MLSRLDWLGHYIVLFILNQPDSFFVSSSTSNYFEASWITFPFFSEYAYVQNGQPTKSCVGVDPCYFGCCPVEAGKYFALPTFTPVPFDCNSFFLAIYITHVYYRGKGIAC